LRGTPLTPRVRVNEGMKSSQPLNVKVAVIEKDPAAQILRNFVLIGFAVVGMLFLVELYIASVLGIIF